MKHLLDVIPFKNHLVGTLTIHFLIRTVYECSDALKHFRILGTNAEGVIDGKGMIDPKIISLSRVVLH